MGINNLPNAIQPAIQEGFLEREFHDGLSSRLGYRSVAQKEMFPTNRGETLTKTRTGLFTPIEAPVAANSINSDLDNGLSTQNFSLEQFTFSVDLYAATTDVDTIAEELVIANLFLQNSKKLGTQAGQSLDRLARNKLFDAHMGGNTRVTATLGSANATITVDDVRGFQTVLSNGKQLPVSGTNMLPVLVGSNTYNLIGYTVDATSTSTNFRGTSGTLVFSTSVLVSDATVGNQVLASNAPLIIRPNGRLTSNTIVSGDTFSMYAVEQAVLALRNNAVPEIDGYYNCILDPTSAQQMLRDPDFKQLFRAYGNDVPDAFMAGQLVSPLLGARFLRNTEAPQNITTTSAKMIHRPIVCGADVLVEVTFSGQAHHDTGTPLADIREVDNVMVVTRAPMSRLQNQVSQSWYWIGGYTVPTDITATQYVIPTASNAAYKRAVIIEHSNS